MTETQTLPISSYRDQSITTEEHKKSLETENHKLKTENDRLKAENYELKIKNDELKEEIEKLKEASLIDPLTNCYNLKYFEKYKEENFDFERDNCNIGLVFVDLNKLKKINDTLGHNKGDEVIKNTADFLKSSFRKEDTVIHIYGDEFLVLCHNNEKDPNFEENLPNKINDRLSKKLIFRENNRKPEDLPLKMAFGVAVYNKEKDSGDLNKTKDRADNLMRINKAESGEGR